LSFFVKRLKTILKRVSYYEINYLIARDYLVAQDHLVTQNHHFAQFQISFWRRNFEEKNFLKKLFEIKHPYSKKGVLNFGSIRYI